ncbi:3-oxoacyl-reductase [Massarina eburnea CBS 473.64]|uniref:3-oxoacyl-reductase n=1 Tax=Massarina eburnea CBS 473.64 TaxID=1395130 RepID=A0A6A6RQL7_9PLEO|nr:3-oxoacyl-reductase [Massarina eburnea CBS 473.64]
MARKCALITGGSRGIGLSIAQLLSRNNYSCTLISRSDSSLKSALATLHPVPDGIPPHNYISGDISRPNFWQTNIHKLTSSYKVLVNCAGITQSQLFVRTMPGDMQNIIDTNLTALMIGTRFLIRNRSSQESDGRMKEHSPVVINVASLLGLHGGYGAVAYAASKAGVLGFTRALATEMGPFGIRVNAIVPGYVDSEMTKDLDQAAISRRIPLGRFGRPEEIASAALFLAQNEYAHNCIINLDGGLSA